MLIFLQATTTSPDNMIYHVRCKIYWGEKTFDNLTLKLEIVGHAIKFMTDWWEVRSSVVLAKVGDLLGLWLDVDDRGVYSLNTLLRDEAGDVQVRYDVMHKIDCE